MANTICRINTHKRVENGEKDGKVLYNLMNKIVSDKTMEHLRNRIGVRLVSNKKDHLKSTSKPTHISQKKNIGQWFNHDT